eukprot:2984343-Pyramimonas_sp.AAC.1
MKGKLHPSMLPAPLYDLTDFTRAVEWAWLLDAPSEVASAYPSLVQMQVGECSHLSFVASMPCSHATVRDLVTPASTRLQHQAIALSLAQYNTRSLAASQKKSSNAYVQGMRSHMTRQHFRDKKIHLVGIQEARTPQGSKRKGAYQ